MYANEDQLMDESACGSAGVSRLFLLQTCIVLAVSVQVGLSSPRSEHAMFAILFCQFKIKV